MGRRLRLFALVAVGSTASCSQFVQYTDELNDPRTGRSAWVTTPASIGRFLGFLAGVPFDVLGLPVTYVAYRVQKSDDPIRADALSTMLFPSFVLGRVGTLAAIPFDSVEYLVHRGWIDETPMTQAQRAEFEDLLDRDTLPQYPVETIYPLPDFEPEGEPDDEKVKRATRPPLPDAKTTAPDPVDTADKQ